jgi:hypothetical protein
MNLTVKTRLAEFRGDWQSLPISDFLAWAAKTDPKQYRNGWINAYVGLTLRSGPNGAVAGHWLANSHSRSS